VTAHHPWMKTAPEKVRGKLDAVSFPASGLWWAVSLYLADVGGDGTILRSKLPLATARRLSARQIGPLVDELIAEGLLEARGTDTIVVVPWEQPPVDVWADDTKRARWQRGKALMRDGSLRQAVKDRDRNLCRYCGVRVNWDDKRGPAGGTYDHVDPDGQNTITNVVVACRRCNARKKDRTPEQAGMPLLRPGTSQARTAASAAGHCPPDLVEEVSDPPDPPPGDSDPIQIGFNSGASPPRARPRDRTDPDPIQIGPPPAHRAGSAAPDDPPPPVPPPGEEF
jgi:5-methylcytosine-specific restriction endonuclease McrA